MSHSVPVFEGYCLPHAVQRFPLAGADVTMQLKKVFSNTFLVAHCTGNGVNDPVRVFFILQKVRFPYPLIHK